MIRIFSFLMLVFIVCCIDQPALAKKSQVSPCPIEQAHCRKLVSILEEADELFSEGRFSKAVKKYEQAVEHAPDSPGGYLGLGRISFIRGEAQKAVANLKKAVEKAPGMADTHFELGSTYLSMGEIDKAIIQLTAASEISPDRPEFRYILAKAFNLKEAQSLVSGLPTGDFDVDDVSDVRVVFRLATSGRVEEAINQARKAAQKHPDSPSLAYQVGVLYKAVGKIDEAVEYFEKTLELEKEHWHALEQLSSLFMAQNDCSRADEYLDEWARVEPDNPTPHFNKAWCQILHGSFDNAVDSLKQSVQLDPRNTEFLNHYGLVLRELGDDGTAARIFGRALILDPEARSPRLNLAMIYLADAHTIKAEEVVAPLRKSDLVAPEVLAVSALIHAHLGRSDEADEESSKALKLIPNQPVALVARAEVLASLGQKKQSMELLARAHKLYPENLFVLQELAETHAQMGNYEEAVRFARDARKINPDRFATDELLVISLARKGSLDEALSVVESLTYKDKERKQLLHGEALEAAGRDKEAVSYYQGLLAKDRYHEQALLALGRYYYKKRKYKKALKPLLRLIDHDPGLNQARLLAARTFFARKQYRESIDNLKRLLKDPDFKLEARCLMGRAYFRMKKYAQSVQEFEECCKTKGMGAEALVAYASALAKVERFDTAAEILERASEADDIPRKLASQIRRLRRDLEKVEDDG